MRTIPDMKSTKNRWLVTTAIITLLIALLVPAMIAGAQVENGITSPADGDAVNGVVEVMGVADHANFAKWQLDILPGANSDAAIFIALGEEAAPTETAEPCQIDSARSLEKRSRVHFYVFRRLPARMREQGMPVANASRWHVRATPVIKMI